MSLALWRGDPHKSHAVGTERIPMYRYTTTRSQRSVSHNRLQGLFNPSAEPETETFRHDLVARMRRQIADGVYETPEKWEAALDRLAEKLM